MAVMEMAGSGIAAPGIPLAIDDRVQHLLDIDVSTLAVPVVGRTRRPSGATDLPLVVFDPFDNEIAWVSRTLRALGANGLAPSTLKAYAKSFLRAARPMWAIGANPETLTITEYAVVRAWLRACMRMSAKREDDAARPLSASTLQQTEAALLSLYSEATILGIVKADPISRYRGTDDPALNEVGRVWFDTDREGRRSGAGRRRSIAKTVEKRIVTLGPEDRARLRHAKRPRDRALWTLCLDSGPRISEALSITPETYYPADNCAYVIGKGLDGGRRMIPLADETVQVMDAYLASLAEHGFRPAPGDPIFRSVKSPFEPLTYNGAHKALRRSLGRKDVHPHALRHTAATELLDLLEGTSGRRLVTVQMILGHKHLTTTRRYLHVGDAEVIAAVIKARKSSPKPSAPVLKETYGAAELDLLNTIRMETP